MASFFFVGDIDNFWNNAGNWSFTSGGAGGDGVPGNADNATIDSNSPVCILDVNVDVANLSVLASRLNQNGESITVSGIFAIDAIFEVTSTNRLFVGTFVINDTTSTIITADATFFMLQENGDFILQENGDKIILEN